MMLKTHVVFSFFIAIVLFNHIGFFDNINYILFFSVFIFAAILPDIDSAKSFLGRKIKIISYVIKHRTIFHSLWLPLGVLLLMLPLDKAIAFVFFLGYCSHLVLDMLNYSGVCFFYPFVCVKGRIKTGSFFDILIFISFFAASLIAIFFRK